MPPLCQTLGALIMAISEFEIKRCEKLATQFIEKHRPPAHLRSKLDLCFRIEERSQSLELFEIRPHWQNETEKIENPIAKATYNKSKKNWKVLWMRADLKWHTYKPVPEVASLEDFLTLVSEDEHACFFG